MSIRILLADDHRLLRDGLRALLSGEPAMKIVGEADNGRVAVELARRLSPDVVLLDANMPELNGALATRKILADCPHVRVIALSMYSDGRFVRDLLRAGASAYLLKTCGFEELVHAIKVVTAGKDYLSPDITAAVVKDYVQGMELSDSAPAANISNRETEVLQLLAEGKTSKEIASMLGVSVKTVTTHRQNIMDKLDIRSVAELTKYAVREGLTTLES